MDKETKQMFELILSKLDSIENRQESMDKRQENMENRQEEIYILQRTLEENVRVTRAEQEKMMYILADIQGKVTKLTEEV